MARKNRGEPIGDTVRFSARELSVATNRPIGGNHYKRLEDAFARLQGAQFVTNIKSGGKIETRIFSLIDEGGFVRTDDERFRLDYCEVKLSRWLMRAIETDQVVTISHDYFRLRRPLERRLYEIARKHCGSSPKWQISLTNLQNKTGSNAPIKRFRHNLREIIKADVTPFYRFEIDEADLVTVRPRSAQVALSPDHHNPGMGRRAGPRPCPFSWLGLLRHALQLVGLCTRCSSQGKSAEERWGCIRGLLQEAREPPRLTIASKHWTETGKRFTIAIK